MSEPSLDTKSLDQAVVGGFAWTAGAKWLSQIVSYPAVLITARILSPSDYGLTEMAGFYFVVTNVVAEFGLGMAVLQMRELDMRVAAQLNTIATLSGVLAFLVSIAAAPLIASFFRAPALHRLVVVASLSFILTSTEAIPLGLLQRGLEYRRMSVAESVQALVTSVTSVLCALFGMAYWAIIIGNLSGRAANIALAVYWRPVGFAWPRLSSVKAPLRFGMEIAVQRIVGSINGLSDSVVIGRTMGQAPVGAYRIAAMLANTPAEKLGALLMRVTGPLFSKVQSDRPVMLRYFLIFSESLAISVFPLLVGLAIVAPEAILLILGPKWAAAAGPLRWLSVSVMFRALLALMVQLLTTLRLTRFGMWMSLVTFVLMPAAFYLASGNGVNAVAAAWIVMTPVTFFPIAIKVFRQIGCTLSEYLNALSPAIVGSVAILIAVLALRSQVKLAGWPGLIEEIAVGGVAYVLVLFGLFRSRIMRFINFFRGLRTRQSVSALAGQA
jgi:PST family polysaccharide transporter